jgi:D-threonate/D-erythronate kinase
MTDAEPSPLICGDPQASVAVAPRLVGLVADDLTGATDSAVQFAEAGWAAHLLRGPDVDAERADGAGLADAGPSLLAVVTGVRPATDDVAADRTAAAVRGLVARGCERLYVKIDSTMRGSVAGQLRGALTAWADTHPGATAVLCPAFPDQARMVVGGEVLVGGVPLARTAAAADAVTPVVDSRLDRLVPGAVAATATGLDRGPGRRHDGRVTFVDAATNADLDAIAACVDRLGPACVAAGSAGLAAAMARRWSRGCRPADGAASPSTRILVGISSRHPVAVSAVQRLHDATPGVATPVHVVTTPAVRVPGEHTAAVVAADFGDRVAAQLAQSPYDVVVLVGGDGAAAVLDRIGATAVTVHSALAPGVPIGAIVGGAADGVRIVTTSGGFGDAESLVRIIDRLQAGAHRRKESS